MPTEKVFNSFLADILRVKGITVEKLAQITGVSERFLELMFQERYDKLPAAPYVRGYITKIAEALSMNSDELWHEYQKHAIILRKPGENNKTSIYKPPSIKINKKIIIGGAIALIILIYVAFRIPALFGNPTLSIGFGDNLVVATSTFTITGKTDPKNELTINDEVIYPDTKGEFKDVVDLSPGFNTFTFKTKELLGAEETVVKQIFFKIEATSTTATSSQQKIIQ